VNGCNPSFALAGVGATTSPAGGTVAITDAANGVVDFDPPAGVTGTVTFTYTVSDNGCPGSATSAPATVTVTVHGPVIWFVNANAASNGTGTLTSPFNTLAAANAVDAADQGIFLYSSATNYTGALTLNTGEKLIGQGTTGTTFD
jgi:large repetitive protein